MRFSNFQKHLKCLPYKWFLGKSEDYLQQAFNDCKLVVTVEEHGRLGGLGSAVSEFISQFGSHPPLLRLGTLDEFMHEMGAQEYARIRYGLDASGIARQIHEYFLKSCA